MNKFKHFALTVLVALVGSLSASAHDFAVKNKDGVTIYYKFLTESTCAVSFWGEDQPWYNPDEYKYSGDVVIPSSVEHDGIEYSVTSIGNYAFCDCSGLTSVEIPNSVTSIGGCAFHCCI